jgi:hypothetical protein
LDVGLKFEKRRQTTLFSGIFFVHYYKFFSLFFVNNFFKNYISLCSFHLFPFFN